MSSFTDAIKQSNKGVILSVHVIPGSSQTVFPENYNQWRKAIEIKVRSEAKANKANKEVRETIAGFFQLSSKNVLLISGEKSREKTICLQKISIDAVIEKLQGIIHE